EAARVVRAGVVDARTQRDERAQAPRSANAEIAEDVVFAADRQVGAVIGRVERLAILDLVHAEAVAAQVQPIVLVDSTDISADADIGEAEQIDALAGNRLGPLAETHLAAAAHIVTGT